MKHVLTCWALFSLFCFSGNAQTLQQTRAMANAAFEAQNFEFARASFQRVAFFEREALSFETLYKLGVCQNELGQYQSALNSFDRAYFLAPNKIKSNEASFAKIQSLLLTKNWKEALIELYSIEAADSLYQSRQDFLLGVCFFAQKKYDTSLEYFVRCVPQEDSLTQQALATLCTDERLNKPNPKVAKVLSTFLPGSGQIYVGNYEAGLNSLLLAAGIVSGGIFIARLYNPIDALVTIVPWFTRYYMGGYSHAEEMAIRKNQENCSDVLNEIVVLLQP